MDRTTQYLQSRLGKSIKLNQKGPESKKGILLDLNSEFLTLLTEEDGVVYYSMHHLKSLSHNSKTKENKPFELPEDFTYLNGSSLEELFTNLDQCWVHVNHGPERVEGVVSAVGDGWITIVTQEDVVRVNLYHVKTLSYGNKLPKNEEQNDQNSNGENGDNKDNKNNKDNKEEKNDKKNKKEDAGK